MSGGVCGYGNHSPLRISDADTIAVLNGSRQTGNADIRSVNDQVRFCRKQV